MPFRDSTSEFPPDVTARMTRVYEDLVTRLGLTEEAARHALALQIVRAAGSHGGSDAELLAESQRRFEGFGAAEE